LVLALCPLAVASATNHYVDKDANGANNGTSWISAWESFADIVWSSIAPGDTLFISGGSSSKTYSDTLYVGADGAAGHLLVITPGNDPGHDGEVVLDGLGSLSHGVDVENDDYVVVRGFKLRNFTSEGKGAIHVSYVTGSVVEDNEIYITSRAGVFVQESTNITVRRNRMTSPTYVAAQTDGIYSQRNTGNTYEHNHIVISNGHTTGHDDGFQLLEDRDIAVRFNYVEQDNSKLENAQGIYCTNSYGTIVVYGNVVYGPITENSLLTLHLVDKGDAKLLAYNNTLVGGRFGALRMTHAPGSVAKNNIVVATVTNGVGISVSGNTSDYDVDYNIYWGNMAYPGVLNDSGKSWAQWQGYGFEANGRFEDPLLVGAALRDFQLQEGSPAIDNGVALGSPFDVDIDGVSRPQGQGWDIGAYEHTGAPPVDWIFTDGFESGDATVWTTIFPDIPD
jgi:parallel beta-helix repeat protein